MPVHNLIDLTGQRFGRLRVIQQTESAYGCARWLCQCDCGMPTRVRSQDLRRGHIRACGCLQREWTSAYSRSAPRKRYGKGGTA